MLNPYPDNGGPKGHSRRDPAGVQHRVPWPDERGSGMRAETKIRQAIDRSEAEDLTPQSRGGQNRRRDPESTDAIYNAFTASYQNQNAEPNRYDTPNGSRHHPYRAQLKEAARSTPRVRRVQFSEQLEVDTKQPPQTPTTPTIPILRTATRNVQTALTPTTPTPRNGARTIYASPRHLIRPNNKDTNRHSRSVPANPRDPTPRSSEKLPELTQSKENSSKKVNSQKATSDPPINRSKMPFFSPASKRASNNILESLERMERRSKDSEQSKGVAQRQAPRESEPPAPAPFRPLQSSQSGERRNPLYPGDMTNSSPLASQLHRLESIDSTLSSHSALQVQNEEPLKAYAPRSDHWDAPDLYPSSWKYSALESPASASENQSNYLINKYTNNSKASIRDLTNQHGNSQDAIPRAGGVLRDETNFHTPEYTRKPVVERGVQSEPWGRQGIRGKKSTKTNGYAQLDDDTEMSFGENLGTELVLLPGLPKQIEIGKDDEKRVGYDSSPTSRKRRGLAKILARRPAAPQADQQASKVPFQRLPVVALSFDEDSADLKQSTDDTDDASDSELHLRTARWNTFSSDTDSEGETKDFLISSHRAEAQKRQRLVLMLVFLVFFCLGVGLPVYFKMVNQVETMESDVIETSNCATGDVQTSSFTERYTTIRKYLEISPAGDVYKLDEADSPQRRALCWIADFDEKELDVTKGDIPALIQRYTLAVIYFSLINDDAAEATPLAASDFLSSAHECDWELILCSVPEKVTGLLLADQELSGILPAEIGNLSYLTFLELSLNDLRGTIPTSISKLSTLEYFAMAFNGLTGTLPAELGLMTKLEFINLRSSQIHGTIPAELGSLTDLETLLLERNWLSGTIPSSLGNLHNAQQFSFRNNYLSGKVAAELCELREGALTELEVDSWIDCECCTS